MPCPAVSQHRPNGGITRHLLRCGPGIGLADPLHPLSLEDLHAGDDGGDFIQGLAEFLPAEVLEASEADDAPGLDLLNVLDHAGEEGGINFEIAEHSFELNQKHDSSGFEDYLQSVGSMDCPGCGNRKTSRSADVDEVIIQIIHRMKGFPMVRYFGWITTALFFVQMARAELPPAFPVLADQSNLDAIVGTRPL